MLICLLHIFDKIFIQIKLSLRRPQLHQLKRSSNRPRLISVPHNLCNSKNVICWEGKTKTNLHYTEQLSPRSMRKIPISNELRLLMAPRIVTVRCSYRICRKNSMLQLCLYFLVNCGRNLIYLVWITTRKNIFFLYIWDIFITKKFIVLNIEPNLHTVYLLLSGNFLCKKLQKVKVIRPKSLPMTAHIS
jgi:hypothetical protein